MNGELKVFKRFNAFDFVCLLMALLAISGFLLAKAQHAGVNTAIRGTQKIDIVLYFMGLKTKDLNLFKVGENANLTVRNQPITPAMTITDVKHSPKQVAFPTLDGKKAVSFADPANPLAVDFEVTVTDTAEMTDDGWVVRGNKLKVGNNIDLEGFKYRVNGVIVDINPSKAQATP